MYTSKYRPNKLEEFIGNKHVIQPFIKWLLEWDSKNKKTKCALVSGVCGIGKSLLVELMLKKHDYNIINLDIDDERSKEYINQRIKPVIKVKKTFNGQENVLVVSDIDGGGDYGFISSLFECIKESEIPVICICDNRYDQSIKPILNYCFDIKLIKPPFADIYRLLYKVVIGEQIRMKESELKSLYEESNGDIRFMLNTLQLNVKSNKINKTKNIQSTNIFDTTAKLLSMDTTIEEKLEVYWLANDIHSLMIQENYVNNTFNVKDMSKKLGNVAYSAVSLSDVDLFDSAINMTNWEFETYVAMSTIQATSNCNKKFMIKFPQILGKISKINKNRRDKVDYNTVKIKAVN